MIGTCIFVDCGRENVRIKRGYCDKHYYRLLTHGDPSISLVPRHGHKRPVQSPEHAAWVSMIQRTENPNRKDWENYGGRGITVEPDWRNSFIVFYREVGPKPSSAHTLERIENDKGYIRGNVRWATRLEQARNMRKNILLTIGDETKPLSQWVEERSVLSYGTIYGRVLAGWDIEKALTLPRVHKSGTSKDLKCLQ